MKLVLKRGLVFWYYKLVARNGQVMMTSEVYFSKGNAKRAADKVSQAIKVPLSEG